jgi:hypothetical protein
MERFICGLFVLLGVGAVLKNRQTVDVAVQRSREQFGIEIRPGTRHYRFTAIFARSLNIVGGSAMAVLGFLGMLGVLPPPFP